MDRIIELRGQSYIVEKMMGDFVIAALTQLDKNFDDVIAQSHVAQLLRVYIPGLPDEIARKTIVDGEEIYQLGLYSEEWTRIVEKLRLLYFDDNLNALKEAGMKKKEANLAEARALVLTRWENSKQHLEPGEEDIEAYAKAQKKPAEGTAYYWQLLHEYWFKEASLETDKASKRFKFCQEQLNKIPQAHKGNMGIVSNPIRQEIQQFAVTEKKKTIEELEEKIAELRSQ